MHATPRLLLIDQDGVLADFDAGVRTAWRQRYGEAAPLTQRRHFYLRDDMAAQHHARLHALYTTAGFFAALPPMPGALAAMQNLLAAGHDVRICTSPINDYRHCVTEKLQWVAAHLGSDWVQRVILTKDKTWVRGDILIDDKPHISGSLTPLWTHWLYDAPYNRDDTLGRRRVLWTEPESWADLLA